MPRGGGGPRSAKEANNPILLKVQSLQLSFRPAGVSLGGGGGGQGPPWPPPCVRPCIVHVLILFLVSQRDFSRDIYGNILKASSDHGVCGSIMKVSSWRLW